MMLDFTFMWNWVSSVLSFLGFDNKSAKLVFLGLDNAGKTTLMYALKESRITQTAPTYQPTSETLTLGKLHFTAFDLGGHRFARRIWETYFPVADAIVFIIDGCDRERFTEAKVELLSLLSDEQIPDVPVLVLHNKIDREDCASEDEIRFVFELNGQTTGKDKKPREALQGRRPLELFSCSVVKQHGYGEGFRWLANYVK